MKNIPKITPYENETAESYAARLSLAAAAEKSSLQKRRIGQYFTPPETARFMASFASLPKAGEKIRILDPGCGTAILSCALIERFSGEGTTGEIYLVCYETDPMVIPMAELALEYLKTRLEQKGTGFSYELREVDFLMEHEEFFGREEGQSGFWDYIISNPPYFKLLLEDARLRNAGGILHGQPNMYSLFLYISARLLKNEGELIFIIPSSFCSCGSFARFRRELLHSLRLTDIHLFPPEKGKVFEEESLSVSPVIIKALKKPDAAIEPYGLNVSASYETSPGFLFRYSYTFRPDENIIRLPVSEEDLEVLERINSFTSSFAVKGLSVNHGRLFMSRLKQEAHIEKGIKACILSSEFPARAGNERSYEIKEYSFPGEDPALIPNGNYVVFPRYRTDKSGKGLMAGVWLKDYYPGEFLAADRKTSYISRLSGELSRRETEALALLLNSDLYTSYIRIINGSLNADEELIAGLPLPSEL